MSELVAIDEYALHAAAARTAGPWSRTSARLCVLFAALACIGVLMVATVQTGVNSSQDAMLSMIVRRLIYTAAGIGIFVAAALVPYRTWRVQAMPILFATMFVLLAVLLWGDRINGARRWISLGLPVTLQPSEFAKIGLLIWLAAWCESHLEDLRSFVRGFMVPMAVVGAAALLILKEPDFGTAVLIGTVCTVVLLVMGTRLVFVVLGGGAAVPVMHELVMGEPYRYQRIVAFLHPESDPQGIGYQLIQSKIAIGSGGIWGLGPGAGVQKLGFLPGTDNDFVFSVLAEELGLLGSVAVIALFLLLMWEGLKVIQRARDPFAFALSTGITCLLGLQAALHVAVVTGSVPTKGLSLPFISAGGSSLLASMLAAGILVNIARSEEVPQRDTDGSWATEIPALERTVEHVITRLGAACVEKLEGLVPEPEAGGVENE